MSTKIVIKSSLLVTNLEKKDQGNKELRFFRMLILIGSIGEDGSYFSIIKAGEVVVDAFFRNFLETKNGFQSGLNFLVIEAGVVGVESSFEGS